MINEIVAGLFAIAGSVVGAIATLLSTSCARRKELLVKRVLVLARQVQAYHKLEELYKFELGVLQEKSPDAVLRDMRSRVEAIDGYSRPTMTQAEAKKILEELG
jgi:hypothetical protein